MVGQMTYRAAAIRVVEERVPLHYQELAEAKRTIEPWEVNTSAFSDEEPPTLTRIPYQSRRFGPELDRSGLAATWKLANAPEPRRVW